MKWSTHLTYLVLIGAVILFHVGCPNRPECPEIPIPTERTKIEPVKPKLEPVAVVKPDRKKNPFRPPITPDTSHKEPMFLERIADAFELPPDENPCEELWTSYNEIKVYDDTYQDSIITIQRHDSIWQNQIIATDMFYTLRPQQPVTMMERRRKVFVGASVGSTLDHFTSINANVMYVSRKDQAAFVGWDFLNEGFQMGIFYKVSLRRP